MSIFKEQIDEEFVTVSEVKDLLAEVEAERAADPDREMRYELARAIEHANTFAVLDAEESREMVEQLLELDQVDEVAAFKIVDILPHDRDELRSVFAHGRYSLDGDELDEILNVVAQYA
jgi:DNA-directed RNA polymerase subunit F